jgi:hypothetical protein
MVVPYDLGKFLSLRDVAAQGGPTRGEAGCGR